MEIYSVADNIISPLGLNTAQNYEACQNDISGIRKINDGHYFPEPFYGAAIDTDILPDLSRGDSKKYTFLEQLLISSITDALDQIDNLDTQRTLLVISTTKGNIDLLAQDYNGEIPQERLELSAMARAIGQYFKLPYSPIVVSNACISGLSAIITAKRFIEMGQYDHAIVTGGDILSEFVISGFQALKAVSDEPCRPYDEKRKGISLGEACGTMILTNNVRLSKKREKAIKILGVSQSNDANHISGPSRTGEGLKKAINRAVVQAGIAPDKISYINAHGTATSFNDEMEAIAFDALGFGETPLNSLKGYFGHTLGAAGVIEAIITMSQMRENEVLISKGFANMGTTKPLNITKETLKEYPMKYALKTTSGFGGCNAAVIFESL